MRDFYQVWLHTIVFKFRAPTDCVQYFTGTSGSVLSYNHAGGQLLQSQVYNNCIRTEKGTEMTTETIWRKMVTARNPAIIDRLLTFLVSQLRENVGVKNDSY